MIKIEQTHVDNIARAVYSARNAMNSWDKSDSNLGSNILGKKDLELASKLAKGGSDHAKYRRMIVVYADIIAPLYWWKEFDTYKVGTVANSTSTMHTIHKKPFTKDDFSIEHLLPKTLELMDEVIDMLNHYRTMYLACKDKLVWKQMIQLLPSSYNQKRTVMLNYEVLANMYRSRKNHKLDEWRDFCNWIETLPYAKELITSNDKGN